MLKRGSHADTCSGIVQCQPWFVNWLRPRAAAVQILDTTFSSDDSHRLELLLSLLGRCGKITQGISTGDAGVQLVAKTRTLGMPVNSLNARGVIALSSRKLRVIKVWLLDHVAFGRQDVLGMNNTPYIEKFPLTLPSLHLFAALGGHYGEAQMDSILAMTQDIDGCRDGFPCGDWTTYPEK